MTLLSTNLDDAHPAALSGRAQVAETRSRIEILVIEDSLDWVEIVRDLLNEASPGAFSIASCERLSNASAHISQSRTDCVLLDLSLPDARGLDALREVQRIAPSIPVVVLSALDDETIALEAVEHGAQDYLVKGPTDGHLLSRAVRYAIERKRLEAEMAVARELALAIGGAETVEEALRLVLRRICERTGWDLGQAWLRPPGRSRLECSPAWYAASEGLEPFRRASEAITFERGIGLPGSAWSRLQPVWFKDVKVDLNFPRAPWAREVGLGAGMAVPVLARDELVAVLEFFVFEQREEDERLIETVSAVAAQLGSLVLRRLAEEALRHSEERLRLVLETAHEAFISIDAEGSITAWNHEAELIFGWTREQALGRSLVDTIIPEQYQDAHKQGFERFLETGEGPVLNKRIELSALHRRGHEFPIELTIAPLRVDDTYVFNAFLRDISERKRAEEEQMSLAASLEESNRELEQFATVASHDLQEPLRKVQAFGSLVTTKYGKLLDETGRDYLDRMENAARRMQALIDNLLTLSRVTTGARPFTAVDLERSAQDAVADLEFAIEERGARVEVGHLPTVTGDQLQMQQLLQNLISNSLKFSSEDSTPVVKVYGQPSDGQGISGVEPQPETFAIFVEDNGIGIDGDDLDRIFQVFERLHSRSEYEGTGMGLAICKKIAKRHGGDITVRSTPGEGSIFIVTLPKRKNEASGS